MPAHGFGMRRTSETVSSAQPAEPGRAFEDVGRLRHAQAAESLSVLPLSFQGMPLAGADPSGAVRCSRCW